MRKEEKVKDKGTYVGMERQKKVEVSPEEAYIAMSHNFTEKSSFMYLYLLQQLTV